MRQVLYILAIFCAILFIIAGVASLLLFNIERRAFDSTTYKQAFEKQGLYDRMPAILASAVQGMIGQNPAAYPFLRELTVTDWQSTITSILPAEDVRALTDSALDSTFEYVNQRSDSVVITLVPIKARLAGPAGMDIVNQFLSTQPACTFEQLQQMALGFLGGQIALCNPPPEAMGLIAPFVQSQLQTVTANFPDQITLVSGTESGAPNDPRRTLHLVRSAVRFSPFFVFLLLLSIAVFAVRSMQDLLVWWGWPLSITGFFSTVIALVGAPAIGLFLQFLIQSQGFIPLPPLLAPSISETISAVTGQMLSPVIWQGLVMTVIGGMMLVLGFFLPRRIVTEIS